MHRKLTTLHSPNTLEIKELSINLASPLPTLVYFALSATNSLILDPFNQPVQFLLDEPIRLISISLPDHHENEDPNLAMNKWATRFKNDPHFFDRYVAECREALFFLIDQGLIDQENLVLAGLSRGGYTAIRLAAESEIFNKVLAFAPLVDLESLSEFKENLSKTFIEKNSLNVLIPKMIGKHIRIHIGNRDTRVGTKPAFLFVESLANISYINGYRSPPVELMITPSIGHKGHGTAQESFHQGALWVKKMILRA